MVFWIAILAGVLLAWLAVRVGFYETWALLFNIVISVYVAVFLAPSVLTATPETSYGMGLTLLALAGGCFAILHGLCYVFLTGQFSVELPRSFDVLLAGAVGFAAGFLALSFVAMAVIATPLAQNRALQALGFDAETQGRNLSALAWSCDRVHTLVGNNAQPGGSQHAIQRLLGQSDQAAEQNTPNAPDVRADPNQGVILPSAHRTGAAGAEAAVTGAG